ncbi:ATP-binding protein [Streptomyces sp. WA6-1-16]|uniref:ATP-binding protein n=1 Tax=Streptomyces sp. WA6-1-16 TaxID=2879427 RepID=UPI001CE26E67|nr:ATP-binding protein [Streptomyces sp. WA6-1-16]UCA50780.1 ATP-binding protein [Streptomyces sp. WA6-1-16]
MPDDGLTRLLDVLSRSPLASGADARTLADAVWLAASGVIGGDGPPGAAAPAPGTVDEPEAEAAGDVAAGPHPGREPASAGTVPGTPVSARGSTSGPTTVRGVPLSLGRADPLPDSLAVGRAFQPFRRTWQRGSRSELDIDATVEHYARGGPLVPLFRPAPEPWFEAVLVIDTSLSMSVWEETTRAVTGLLTALGGFRAVHTWRLEWQDDAPRVRDHHGREVPGDRVPHQGSGAQGRRLILMFSDCAARGWHTPAPWLLLRDWAHRVPVALVDPLPPRLWRRSALDLPAVHVTNSQAGAHNGALRFTLPRRLADRADGDASAGPWTALPVLSCTPRLLGAWAATLMRSDPAGCGAVLVPATGRLLPRSRDGETPPRQPDPGGLAEAFVHTSPSPAVRLAVLCSGLPGLPLPLLHVLHNEVVPEASYADLAEVLTSGLFSVRREAGSDPVLLLRDAARSHLRSHLTTHDQWRTRAAFSRYAAAHPYAPQGIAAVLHSAWSATELPAQQGPFAETTAPAPPEAEESAGVPAPDAPSTAADAPAAPSAVVRQAVSELRSVLGSSVDGHMLQDAETLLRHLVDYAHAKLPAPLGGWPGQDTYFDSLRLAAGGISAADLREDLIGHHSREQVLLRPLAGTGGRGLVWRARGGPVVITLATPSTLSASRATAMRTALGSDASRACPVEFVVALDESDKRDGLDVLDRCVQLDPWQADPREATVLVRVQTRYGRSSRGSRTAFVEALRDLHRRAGRPAHMNLVQAAARETPPIVLWKSTLTAWLEGRSIPADDRTFDWLARHLFERAPRARGQKSLPFELARLRHHALAAQNARHDKALPVRGSRIGNPVHALGGDAEEGNAVPYTERSYDQLLWESVRACAAGASRMVLLVGPAGSGKSRSVGEAVRRLPDDWWLWRPDTSAELAAALDDPSAIASRTVIWLDDAERFLLGRSEGPPGEAIAAGLEKRLREVHGRPVLVLACLRTEDWRLLTPGPGPDGTAPHARARALCDEGLVLHPWTTQSTVEIENYRIGPAAARALVDAAIDVRRCGHPPVMPARLLLEAAGAHLSAHLPRTSLTAVSPDVLADMGLYGERPDPDEAEPGTAPAHYRLSESMERHGREVRRDVAPPDTVWDALADHVTGSALEGIIRTALGRGDARQSARFRALARADKVRRRVLKAREQEARMLQVSLQRTTLPEAEAHSVVDRALSWLSEDGGTPSAQLVLAGLLPRTGLSPAQASQAVQQALSWLTTHGLTKEAATVLHPALLREGLSRTQVDALADAALDWLDRHGERAHENFVLNAALRRHDLAPERRTRLVDFGITWLLTFGTDVRAGFVLSPLLQRRDLTVDERRAATTLALEWLLTHGVERDAQFVLATLLYRRGLRPEEVRVVGEKALDWLELHGGHASARHVLRALLECDGLDRSLMARAVAAGERWRSGRPPGSPPDGGLLLVLRERATGEIAAPTSLVLAARVAGRTGGSTGEEAEPEQVLRGVLSEVLGRHEGLDWSQRSIGDGLSVVMVPNRRRRAALVPALLRDLSNALRGLPPSEGLRLRLGLHCGEPGQGAIGPHRPAIVTASRLADSHTLRTALTEAAGSTLAVAVSDELFTSPLFGPDDPMAARFRRVHLTYKRESLTAWISASGNEEPSGIEP